MSNKAKAAKKIKKYYKTKKGFVEERSAEDIQRLIEDFETVLRQAGIGKTREEEDYVRNIGRIARNKAADIDDLNYYVKTQKGKTSEDLDTGLKKEMRRFSLSQENFRQNIGASGLTYGGLRKKGERLLQEESQENVEALQTTAKRSFKDIARYEYEKNRNIQYKYGDLAEDATTTKQRNIEDIESGVETAATTKERGIFDVDLNKASDIFGLKSERDTALAQVNQAYSLQNYQRQRDLELFGIL